MALHTEPLLGHPALQDGDVEWLHLVVGDWQLVADLAFADLVLWFPVDAVAPTGGAGRSFVALAQARPLTSQTSLHRDIVGSRVRADLRPLVDQVWSTGEPEWTAPSAFAPDSAMRVSVWPVTHRGRTVAVLTVHQDLTGHRTPSRLELTYRRTATDLLTMASRGQWPDPAVHLSGSHRGMPRVGDGLLRLHRDGTVEFATPNAVSAFRRLGYDDSLEGQSLARVITDLQDQRRPVDESLPLVLTGKATARADLEIRSVSVTLRSVPLQDGTGRAGAIVLLRDVTELRRREQQLVSKDATIREIHHRVKNNLQTVAALLRMQARRMTSDEARHGLEQAMRRVGTIALVHETLSQGLDQHVDMDVLIGRQFRLAVEIAGDGPGAEVTTRFEGGFGQLHGDLATPLALIINELTANAVEHGLAGGSGEVGLSAERRMVGGREQLRVCLWDSGAASGRGLGGGAVAEEAAFSPGGPVGTSGLGLKIVHTLVQVDLQGTIEWRARHSGGTEVRLELPLESAAG